jgi:hypothetical protein
MRAQALITNARRVNNKEIEGAFRNKNLPLAPCPARSFWLLIQFNWSWTSQALDIAREAAIRTTTAAIGSIRIGGRRSNPSAMTPAHSRSRH